MVVPFGAGYRPMWTGLRTLAVLLLLLSVVTCSAATQCRGISVDTVR